MYIGTDIIEQVRNTDMIDFLSKRNGFTFSRNGDTYRCKQHPSLAIKEDRLSWFWHSRGIGGRGCLDYLTKIENMPFRDAVQAISGVTQTTAPPQRAEVRKKTLVLPEKTGLPIRLYDYLCNKRGIDGTIVNSLMLERKLYEDRRGNIVFVAFDEHGEARFASVRGTQNNSSFRADCAGSDKSYGFNMTYTTVNQLYLYESPIDAMSHATMEIIIKGDKSAYRRNNRLSLAGTSDIALPMYLEKHPFVKELVFCLDNDEAGRVASSAMSKKYAEKGYFVRVEAPLGKDYNNDLLNLIKQIQREKAIERTSKDDRSV